MLLEAAAGNTDLAAVVSEGAGTRTFKEDVQEFSGRSSGWATPS